MASSPQAVLTRSKLREIERPEQALHRLCTKSPVRNLTQRSRGTFWPHFKGFSRPKSSVLHTKSVVKEHFWCKAPFTQEQWHAVLGRWLPRHASPRGMPEPPSAMATTNGPSLSWLMLGTLGHHAPPMCIPLEQEVKGGSVPGVQAAGMSRRREAPDLKL